MSTSPIKIKVIRGDKNKMIIPSTELKDKILEELIKNLVKDDCSGYDSNVPLNTIYEDPEYNNVDPVYEIKIIEGSLVLEFGWNIRSEWSFGQQVCYLQLKSIMKDIIGW